MKNLGEGMNNKKWLKTSFVWIVLLAIVTFLLTELAASNSDLTDRFYSQGLYYHMAKVLAFFSGWLPFSLDDLFYIALIFWLLSLIVLPILRKMQWKKALMYFIQTLAIVYIVFYWFWGFNYYRSDLNNRLGLTEAKANSIELMKTFNWLIDEVNKGYSPMDSVGKDDLVELIEKEYIRSSEVLKIDADLCHTHPKLITFSRFFAAATISGYYGPFFSEVHINQYLLPVELPLVLAHELAHRYGITSEAEANFYAWYVCTHSNNRQLKYSANLYLLRYFVYSTYQLNGFEEAVEKISPQVKADYRKVTEHWLALMNENVEGMASAVNDAYLKTNKVEEGIDDYEGVIKCVMDYMATKQYGQ